MSEKIICTNKDCGNTFLLKLKFGKREDLTEVFFICPHCNRKYHCYYENDKTLMIQDSINTINAELKNIKIQKKYSNFAEMFNKKQEKLNKLKELKEHKKRALSKINKGRNDSWKLKKKM